MTKKEMAKAIVDEIGLAQVQVQEIIQRVLDGITETLWFSVLALRRCSLLLGSHSRKLIWSGEPP